jgi:arylsulfatase
VISPGQVSTALVSSEDWFPTLVAAAGVRDVKQRLLRGYRAGRKTFEVHLDGYDQSALLAGEGPSARNEFFYVNDEGQLVALRHDRWKVVFAELRAEGLKVWQEPFVPLRLPKLFDLRADPFERGDQGSIFYDKWRVDRAFVIIPALAIAKRFVASFEQFPPRQRPETWNLETILRSMERMSD